MKSKAAPVFVTRWREGFMESFGRRTPRVSIYAVTPCFPAYKNTLSVNFPSLILRCTEEFRVAQNQAQKFYVEIEQKLQQSDETIRELRRTIVEQVREISELKSNALTPQREEVIKLNIQTELEKEFHGGTEISKRKIPP